MRGIGKSLTCALFAAASMLVTPEVSQAVEVSHKVHGSGEGGFQDSGFGGYMYGQLDQGSLRGDISGGFYPESQDNQNNIIYAGGMAIATRHGDLYMSVPDLVSDGNASSGYALFGKFSAHATITGGTGRYEGATGQLSIRGSSADGTTLVFDEISGTVVVDAP